MVSRSQFKWPYGMRRQGFTVHADGFLSFQISSPGWNDGRGGINIMLRLGRWKSLARE